MFILIFILMFILILANVYPKKLLMFIPRSCSK